MDGKGTRARPVWLVAQGRVGEPLRIAEREVGDEFVMDEGTCAWSGLVRQGRQWKTATVSRSRLGKVECDVHQGVLTGSVWCPAEEKAEYRARLTEALRGSLHGMIDAINRTIEGLDASDDAAPGTPAEDPGAGVGPGGPR